MTASLAKGMHLMVEEDWGGVVVFDEASATFSTGENSSAALAEAYACRFSGLIQGNYNIRYTADGSRCLTTNTGEWPM